MALIRCRDCGEVVSSLVSTCPTCRAPMPPLPPVARRAVPAAPQRRLVLPLAKAAPVRRHSHFPTGG